MRAFAVVVAGADALLVANNYRLLHGRLVGYDGSAAVIDTFLACLIERFSNCYQNRIP